MGGPKILGGRARHGGGRDREAGGGRTDWQTGSAPDQSISNIARFGMMTKKRHQKQPNSIGYLILL